MAIDVSNASSGRLLASSTPDTPSAIVAAEGVFIANVGRELQYLIGSTGPVIVTAGQRVQRGTIVGQELYLYGTSDINTVTLQNGNGLALNGVCVLKNHASLVLIWDGFVWGEVGRNDL